MAKSVAAAPQTLVPQKGWHRFAFNCRRDWMLYAMCLVPMIYVLIFNYVPMYGIQLAFRDYRPRKGIWGSPWIGWDNYREFFSFYRSKEIILNTLAISTYQLATFPLPVLLALVIHVYKGKTFKKIVQNVSYVPHFISLVVLCGMLSTMLSPMTGIVATLNKAFGWNIGDLRSDPAAYRHVYIWSGIWQDLGWNTILYLSALSGVPDEVHEAAKVDGASRFRRIWVVDFPTILPMCSLMLIMQFGNLFSVGYQKAYLLMNDTNSSVAAMMSTYVYTHGVRTGNMGLGQAVGLMNSILGMTLTLIANGIADRLSDGEMALF